MVNIKVFKIILFYGIIYFFSFVDKTGSVRGRVIEGSENTESESTDDGIEMTPSLCPCSYLRG